MEPLVSRYRVNTYEVDPFGSLRPSSLMNFLQESAGAHAGLWQLSVTDLLSQGFTWVLSRYHVRIFRRPRVGEELEVETWPSSRAEYFTTRDFEVRALDGTPLAVATSSWALLELKTKRPVPVARVVEPGFILERRSLPDEFPRLPQGGEAMREVQLPVMLRDLDLNGHVNHVVYVQWALEAVPVEQHRRSRLYSVEAAYRAEVRHGEQIRSLVSDAGVEDGKRTLLHQLLSASTGQEVARLRTVWDESGSR